MNKRIEELKKEAAKQSAVMFMNLVFTDKQKTGDELFLEKFAELIAKECVDICSELHWNYRIGDESGPKECAERIKKHFGVEE